MSDQPSITLEQSDALRRSGRQVERPQPAARALDAGQPSEAQRARKIDLSLRNTDAYLPNRLTQTPPVKKQSPSPSVLSHLPKPIGKLLQPVGAAPSSPSNPAAKAAESLRAIGDAQQKSNPGKKDFPNTYSADVPFHF